MENITWPLMAENIDHSDIDPLIDFLKTYPRLTQGKEVREFEYEWSQWLGVKHSVLVNSGSSANFLTLHALRHIYGDGEVIVPPLTWISDISSILNAGLTPVFADISLQNLALNPNQVKKQINKKTRAIFLTHVLGLNGLSQDLLDLCRENNILLIEDVCESHGASFQSKKLGTFGLASNFSYYFGHHMSTIEGGMVCTNNEDFYEVTRSLRSHGMAREFESLDRKTKVSSENPLLYPEFIFSYPGFNMRSTEIQAHIGRTQLKRLNEKNETRIKNNALFLQNLDPQKYFTAFDQKGSVNYAFILVMNPERKDLQNATQKISHRLTQLGIEFRRGLSGGGNQLRQPYWKNLNCKQKPEDFPVAEFIHQHSLYVGNYPGLSAERILQLCEELNKI